MNIYIYFCDAAWKKKHKTSGKHANFQDKAAHKEHHWFKESRNQGEQ